MRNFGTAKDAASNDFRKHTPRFLIEIIEIIEIARRHETSKCA